MFNQRLTYSSMASYRLQRGTVAANGSEAHCGRFFGTFLLMLILIAGIIFVVLMAVMSPVATSTSSIVGIRPTGTKIASPSGIIGDVKVRNLQFNSSDAWNISDGEYNSFVDSRRPVNFIELQ